MSEEQMYEKLDAMWMKIIEALDAMLNAHLDNCCYADAINIARAIEQCYYARMNEKYSFDGIELP